MGSIATGNWLTGERIRRIAALSAIGGLGMLLLSWFARSGTVGPYGLPVGGDFTAFWAAGHLANQGHPATAWDQQALNDFIARFHGVEFGTAWIYPPPFLLIAAPLGALAYLPALFLFQVGSLAAITGAAKLILSRWGDTLVALASPMVLIVLPQGQNSLLTAALLGSGLALIASRPSASGAAFGAMIYKPQLGLVIVPFLLLGRSWKVIVAACVTAVLLIVVSTVAFRTDSWPAWWESLRYGRYYMEQGSVGFHKSASLFAMVRLWGGPVTLGYAVQALGLIVGLALLWHTRAAVPDIRAAAAAAALALSTPYLLDYDLIIVGVGAAFLYRASRESSFLPFEKSALAFIWIMPWFVRPAAEYLALPLGPPTMLLLASLAWRRA